MKLLRSILPKVLLVLYLCTVFIVLFIVVTDSLNWFVSEEENIFKEMNRSGNARFEYIGEADRGYKYVEADMHVLRSYFSSLRIVPTEKTFDEDWIFRIIFNWNSGLSEITVLVGATSMSFNNVVYVPEDGVQMSSILNQLLFKYNYIEQVVQYD